MKWYFWCFIVLGVIFVMILGFEFYEDTYSKGFSEGMNYERCSSLSISSCDFVKQFEDDSEHKICRTCLDERKYYDFYKCYKYE